MLLACRFDDSSEGAEMFRASQCSEAPRDLDADLAHPQVPLGLVIGEGNAQVSEEPQDIGLAVAQPKGEIVSGSPFWSAARGFAGGE